MGGAEHDRRNDSAACPSSRSSSSATSTTRRIRPSPSTSSRRLSTPANANGPVPVVMMFGGGPHSAGAPRSPNPCAPPGGCQRAARLPAGAARAPAPALRRVERPRPATGGAQGPNVPGADRPARLGLRELNTASIQADSGSGLTSGIIGLVNKGQPRKLDDWGVALGVGLGHEQGARLLRDRQGRRRQEGRRAGTLALGQGGARRDGVRRALPDRLHQLVG